MSTPNLSNKDTLELLTVMELLSEINARVDEDKDLWNEYSTVPHLPDTMDEGDPIDPFTQNRTLLDTPEEDLGEAIIFEHEENLHERYGDDLDENPILKKQFNDEIKQNAALDVLQAKRDRGIHQSNQRDEEERNSFVYFLRHILDEKKGTAIPEEAVSEGLLGNIDDHEKEHDELEWGGKWDMVYNEAPCAEIASVLSKIKDVEHMIEMCGRLKEGLGSQALYLLSRELALKKRHKSALTVASRLVNFMDREHALDNISRMSGISKQHTRYK